jgi:hypothetical protein
MTVRWASTQVSAGATFVLEVGRGFGAADVGTYTAGSSLSYTVSNLPTALLYVRVRTKIGEAVSSPSFDVSVNAFELREYIEALFLGSGPVAQTGNPGCLSDGRRSGFPDGTMVTVLASATLSGEQLSTLRAFVDRLPDVTAGRLTARVQESPSDNPFPTTNQTAVTVGDPSVCQVGASGCARTVQNPAGVFQSSSVIVIPSAPPAIIAHELGHALLGLCHIQTSVIGGNRFSVMTAAAADSPHELSAYDVTATRAVHAASVRPGDPRSAFVAAGLINSR